MPESFLASVNGRTGHFQLESGHHAEYWMDLESLCLRPSEIQPFAAQLAAKLAKYGAEIACGPLNEGAFVALMVAAELDLKFTYAERIAHPQREGLYPIEYKIPKALHSIVRGRRVAIVNDVISAGSAVRGTLIDLRALGANVVAVGALLALGSEFRLYASDNGIPLETLVDKMFNLWTQAECPLCRAGTPIEVVG